MSTYDDRRDEVAAHQAECLCHVVKEGCGDGVNTVCEILTPAHEAVSKTGVPFVMGGSYRMLDASDSTGQSWHIDPLCKVRPGREAQ